MTAQPVTGTKTSPPAEDTASEETVGESLHSQLVDIWGSGIVTGVYPAGSRLSYEDSPHGLSVSRSVAREATRVLESMGLVTVRRRVGAIVNESRQWNVFNPLVIAWQLDGPGRLPELHWLSQLRAAVEPMAARLAASNAAGPEQAELTQHALDMVANANEADKTPYLEADARFHAALLAASGNPLFAALGDVVRAVLIGRTQHDLMPAIANPTAVNWHVQLAAAIRSKDADAAEDASRSIVQEADSAMNADN
jgi:DNA-binding FadR family transcriptional regulator